MSSDRITALETMHRSNPDDTRILFALALEHEKAGDWDRVVDYLTGYLAATEDEGNAWGRLGAALARLGRLDEARNAYARGIDAANRHGHPTMAGEFEDEIDGLADD
jgi:E3 SUMO-protein ligase RanBP2